MGLIAALNFTEGNRSKNHKNHYEALNVDHFGRCGPG